MLLSQHMRESIITVISFIVTVVPLHVNYKHRKSKRITDIIYALKYQEHTQKITVMILCLKKNYFLYWLLTFTYTYVFIWSDSYKLSTLYL